MRKINFIKIQYLILIISLLFSCNTKTETIIVSDTHYIDSIDNDIQLLTLKYDSITKKLDSINNNPIYNKSDYFIIAWSDGSRINFILLRYKLYDYVIKNIDESRINGQLDRDRLMKTCDFIYKNRRTHIKISTYDKVNYKFNNYNIVKIIHFPEMLIKY